MLVGRRAEQEANRRSAHRDRSKVLVCRGDVSEEDVAGKILPGDSSPAIRCHLRGRRTDDGVLLEQSWVPSRKCSPQWCAP